MYSIWSWRKKTLRNKLLWNFNRYSYIFIQENSFENGVREIASILFRPQCVKQVYGLFYYVLSNQAMNRSLIECF